MRRFGSSFEHNRHALRIVDALEQRYARFDGLNLTFEVREGIIKHSREVGEDADPELQDLLPGQRPSLEAQLLDAADEIAYNTADMDDAFSAGLFSLEEIAESVPAFARLREQIDNQFPGASDRLRFWEIQREIINLLVGGLIEGTIKAADAANVETVEDVRALDQRLAQLAPEAAELNSHMKSLLMRRVYSYAQLVEERSAAVSKMGELFTFLVANPDHISAGYRENLDRTPVHRVVCDYIAGMTDSYLMRVYRELLG